MTALCPVCHRHITASRWDLTPEHHDTNGVRCPASSEPWRITETLP